MVENLLDQNLQIIIRTFDFPDDYVAVYKLWENSGPGIHIGRSDTEEEIRKKILRDPDLFILAEANNQVIGSVLGGFDGRRGMVYHLAIDRAYQNRGIGTLLIQSLEDRLREKGCIRYYLLVTMENHEAITFYENHGWQRMDLFTYGKNID